MSRTTYFTFSFFVLIVVQFLSLGYPPLGILAGTPLILPIDIWLAGNSLHDGRKEEITLLTVLIFSQVSKTLDWFFAPGTHDWEGIGFMFVMTIVSSVLMFCLGIISLIRIKKRSDRSVKIALILCFALLIVPTLHHGLLIECFNFNLGQTNKTLWEYFK